MLAARPPRHALVCYRFVRTSPVVVNNDGADMIADYILPRMPCSLRAYYFAALFEVLNRCTLTRAVSSQTQRTHRKQTACVKLYASILLALRSIRALRSAGNHAQDCMLT